MSFFYFQLIWYCHQPTVLSSHRCRHIIPPMYIALQAMYRLSFPSRSISFPTPYYIVHSVAFFVVRVSCIRWELTSSCITIVPRDLTLLGRPKDALDCCLSPARPSVLKLTCSPLNLFFHLDPWGWRGQYCATVAKSIATT